MPKPVRKPSRKAKRKPARKPVKGQTIKPSWTMHHGDCLQVTGDMPDECVHSVVTSPPYWALRDYGKDDQHGLEDTLEEWLGVQVAVFEQVRRILRPDGTLWLNIGDNYINGHLVGQPWALALAMKKAGWVLRADIVWSKPNPIPQPAGRRRPALSHEYIFLFAKQTTGYYFDDEAVKEKSESNAKPQGSRRVTYARGTPDEKNHFAVQGTELVPPTRNLRTVWNIPAGGAAGEGHFAAFPERLPETCIKAGTSEHGCCEVCGKPYERILEKTELGEKLLGKEWHDRSDALGRGHRDAPPKVDAALYRTAGWKAGCDCGGGVAPCRVFDPYTGSGTTGRVALSLGRSFTGIELNDDYFKLAQKRLIEGSSRGGQVSDEDLQTRSDLGQVTDLEKSLFGLG